MAYASPSSFPGTAADLTDAFVLQKCSYFTRVRLWPLKKDVNPELWLNNFTDVERRHARYLLNSFLFFSDDIVKRLVVDNFERLSQNVVLAGPTYEAGRADWASFVSRMRVVMVRGESPHPTDSGYLFTRIVRDELDFPEDRILDMPEALRLMDSGWDGPLVFVDDFVGSGDQFQETWTRPWPLGAYSVSLSSLCAGRVGPFVYLPVISTQYGLDNIRSHCPEVRVSPAHVLPQRYSVLHPESLVWPEELRPTATDFLKVASARAGIPDTGGGPDDWRGYHKLGLTLAFSHGVPDATIPLFWWESETWNFLKKRHREY